MLMCVLMCVWMCVYVWQVGGYTYVMECIGRSEDNCVSSFSLTFTFITGSVTQTQVASLRGRLFTHWIISPVHNDVVLKHDMNIWLTDDRHASDCPGNKPGLAAQPLCHSKVRDNGEERMDTLESRADGKREHGVHSRGLIQREWERPRRVGTWA